MSDSSESTPDPKLQRLICNNDLSADEEEIIKIIQTNPSAAEAKYTFRFVAYYPIDIYLQLHASFAVINALYRAFPKATNEKFGRQQQTLLHRACMYCAPLDVVSLFMDEMPEAIEMKDEDGMIPLHYACRNWMHSESWDVISLLLERCPLSIKTKDGQGRLPLHWACMRYPSPKVLSLLLEKYPHAVQVKVAGDKTPLDLLTRDLYGSSDVEMVLAGISFLLHSKENADKMAAMQIINNYIGIEWWGGVILVLDLLPPAIAAQCLKDIPLNTIPSLLTMVGRRCKISTLWKIMTNRQDILKIK